jgi:hypothetical protein
VGVDGLFFSPSNIREYVWKAGIALAPPQVATMDSYDPVAKAQTTQRSANCWSVRHWRANTVPVHPASALVFQKPLCHVCFVQNLKRPTKQSDSTTCRSWTAKEIARSATVSVVDDVMRILQDCRWAALVSQLDSTAAIALTDTTALEIHGQAVALHYYHWPDIYLQRCNAFCINEHNPGRAFGVLALMSASQHIAKKRHWDLCVRRGLQGNTPALDHYGRTADMPTFAESAEPALFMSHVLLSDALATGVQPWHMFIVNAGLWISRATALVWRLLRTGGLRITIHLVPPVDTVVPKLAGVHSVRRLAALKCKGAAMRFPALFTDGEYLSYAYLEDIIEKTRLHTPDHDVIKLTIEGAYARAASGVNYRGIVAGGTFVELVGLARRPEVQVTVNPTTPRNDPINYASHPAAAEMAMLIRAERKIIADEDDPVTAMATVCERIGIPASDGIDGPARGPPPAALLTTLSTIPWEEDLTLSSTRFAFLMQQARRKDLVKVRDISTKSKRA